MVDNLTLNSGSGGATLAADDIAGVHHQRVKIQQGADGSASDVSDSNPLPIDDAGGSLTVDDGGASLTVDGTVTANAGSGPWPVTDNGGSLSVDDGAGSLTVDGTVTANAGAGPWPVTDNGGSLTVDGTVTASAGTGPWPITDNGGALSIDDGGNVISVDDAGGSLTVDGTVTANAGTGTRTVGGVAAHDAAVSGNPVLGGGEARTSLPTAVGNGDAVRLQCDDLGRQVTAPHAPRDLTTHNRITLANTTETTLIAAGGAGVFRDLVFLSLSNESATEVRVDIRDSSAGTVRLSMDLAPDGGGAVIPFPVPLKQATANNAWTAQLSAAASTVYITAIAVDNN